VEVEVVIVVVEVVMIVSKVVSERQRENPHARFVFGEKDPVESKHKENQIHV
jgi:hypothetical protein